MCAFACQQPAKQHFWVKYEDDEMKNPFAPVKYGVDWLLLLNKGDTEPKDISELSDSSSPRSTSSADSDCAFDMPDVGGNLAMTPSGRSVSSEF